MGIMGGDGEFHPILSMSRATRDALATYCQQRWPTGRRKAIEREWGLTGDQARSVLEATASASTIDRIWKHERGGWAVILPVLGAVVGQPVSDFFREEIRKAAREQQQLEHHATLADAAWSRRSVGPGGPGHGRQEADRPTRRQA